MKADAFKAGVKPGGLLNSTQIKVLICYILSEVEKPIQMQKLQEIFHYDGLANYFELSQAISELKKTGNVVECTDESLPSYTVTEAGREVSVQLSDTLPRTVREKAIESATKLMVRTRRQKSNLVTINECDGGYRVVCTVTEAERELMSVSVVVPKISEAEQIKLNFLDDPSKVYSGMLELLTNEKMHYDPKTEPIV